MTINGPGAGNLAVNGNAASRVSENFASNASISGFTITNGAAASATFYGDGGGIYNNAGGGLTLSDSSVVNNTATGSGGGIATNVYFSAPTVTTVTNSAISNNVSILGGGGIFFSGPGTLTVTNSTISGNQAADAVGDAPSGGIHVDNATATVSNSTINGNTSQTYGGGIGNYSGMLTVTNSTISGNLANTGGGIYSRADGAAQIGDTILDAGASGGTIAGAVTSLGYNLASDGGGGVLTGPGDITNIDPRLGPLQDNGGPTLTQALLPCSPAIDAGNPSFMPPPYYDQRGPGFDRVRNGRIDIGSFEVQEATPTPTPTPTATSTPTPTATATPTPTPTATATATPTPTPTATATARPTPRPRPTPHIGPGQWRR